MTKPQKTHLLIVDDEPEMREELFSFFTDEGFRVTTVSTGEEGIEAYLADPADAVITDIRMPRGDGHELIERLQAEKPDLPILILTGQGSFKQRDTYLGKSLITVLKKPTGLREISSALDRMLQRR